MINVRDDREHDAIIVEMEGDVDVEQARRLLEDFRRIAPGHAKGFSVLADVARVETIDVEVENQVKEIMKYLNGRGAGAIIRVLPDLELAVGLDALARCFYSPEVKFFNFTSREAAQQCLIGRGAHSPG